MCGGNKPFEFIFTSLKLFSISKNKQQQQHQKKRKKNDHIMSIPYHIHSISKLHSDSNNLQQFQLQFQLHSVTRGISLHQGIRI